MNLEDNRRTVRTHLHHANFDYDCLKGVLKKGSHISKSVHPVPEVEKFKKSLITNNKVTDCGTYLVTKSQIHMGIGMAENLYCGNLVDSSKSFPTMVVDPYSADKLKLQMELRNIYCTSDNISSNMCKYAYKLENILSITVNSNFYSNNSDNCLRDDEALVANILMKIGLLGVNYRHGNANNHEADLVDSDNSQQFEISYYNTYQLPDKEMSDHYSDPFFVAIQLVDSNCIHLVKSVIKKLTTKSYTNKYTCNLVLWGVGTFDTISTALDRLREYFTYEKIEKVPYNSIIFMFYDFINEHMHIVQLGNKLLKRKIALPRKEFDFITLEQCSLNEMVTDTLYLFVMKNLFRREQPIFIGDKDTAADFLKNYSVWL